MPHFNWLQFIISHHYLHVACGTLVLGIILALAHLANKKLEKQDNSYAPQGEFNVLSFFEALVDFIHSKGEAIIGTDARKYTAFFSFLFLFIVFNNMLGLLPGFTSASENINTTLAVGLIVFVFYNKEGIREQGIWNYAKHFLGPVWWIAPLLFAVEIVSHVFRPFTLGLRLMGNMKGDHTVLTAFLDLVPLVVPVIFYALGLFVSIVQALVFTLLSMVYVSMAVAKH